MNSRDIYQEVTNKIVAALEAGTVPWLRPWKDGKTGSPAVPHNAVTGRPYNGINLIILGLSCYSDLGWLTFKQAKELGGSVRKGEKGTTVVFWKFIPTEDENGKAKTIPVARAYTVFNVSQCDKIDATKLKRPAAPVAGETDIDAIAQRVGADVRHGGNRAFYTSGLDYIQVPSVTDFKLLNHYQSTLAHELVHWTGHTSRCARAFGKRFGDQAYAFEELVAEIGSAFLCATIGIDLDSLQHPSYIANWLTVLKNDKRAIFTAASKSKQAAEFILKPEEVTDDDDMQLAA